jgi:hypothetical protein
LIQPDEPTDLGAEDDLADIEFTDDDEARANGFVPGWQVHRHLSTGPGRYGHTNVHGTPSAEPTREQKDAEDKAEAAAVKTEERRRGPAAEHRPAGRDRDSHGPPQGAAGPQGLARR